MSDIIDVMYRLRNMTGIAADELRAAIKEAQAVLDKLERFADDAEDGAELLAASDLHPRHHALVPERAGLQRKTDWKWRDPLGNLIPEGTTHALAQNGNGDPTCVCGYEPKAASQLGAASIIEGHVKSMRES